MPAPDKDTNSEAELVTLRIEDGIGYVGLNRPEKRNALSDRVIDALADAVDKVNESCAVAIIHGHGKHFSAGLDLAEHVSRGTTEGVLHSRHWHEIFRRIEEAPIPWLCAIHGAAIGGGLELMTSTHLRIAEESAYFALPEGQRGIFVGGGGSVRIGRLIGAARMVDMMLTGRSVTAEEAERWNLIQYRVADGEALAHATELARRIATNARFSNYAIVQALGRIQEMPSADGLFLESMVAAIASGTDDAKDRLRQFLDKKAGKVGRPQ